MGRYDGSGHRGRRAISFGGALETALRWAVAGSCAYLLIACAVNGLLVVLAMRGNLRRSREEQYQHTDALARSALTIPVSIIAPAFNEAALITASVTAMLDQQYPAHEVIVVNDGLTDETLAELVRTFGLRRRDVPTRGAP